MTNVLKNSIPNSITCCNLLSGALACIAAFQGPAAGPLGLSGFELAWLLITAAAAFDFFDGFAARLLHAYSPLGKELDSLADLISFGLAPGLLMFNLFGYLGAPEWLHYLPLVIPVCGALRLARFNIDTRQTTSFIGLPIPSNAIFWIGCSAWLLEERPTASGTTAALLALAVIAISLSMVCSLPMFSLKFHNLRLRDNALRFLLIGATALLLAIFGVPGAALAILLYFVLSIADTLGRRSK